MADETIKRQDRAIGLLCAKHLHRVLWLPETSRHARLRVTYATSRNFDNTTLPVVLVIGPMFNCRWLIGYFDELGARYGLRLICPDRPGVGGSTAVPLSERVSIWIETVPALLRELNVKHVSIISHSAGTIYTLNTLMQLPEILHPEVPIAIFFAPFVPNIDSHATLTTLLGILPTGVLDSWSSIAGFVAVSVAPVIAWPSSVWAASLNVLSTSSSNQVEPRSQPLADRSLTYFGVGSDTESAIEKLCLRYRFAEATTGVNEEAKLCLRRCGPADWGVAWDYASCVRGIVQRRAGLARLTVAAVFAASDALSGKVGQAYFETCWRQDSVSAAVDFTTTTCVGADHDSILDPHQGMVGKAFAEITKHVSRSSV